MARSLGTIAIVVTCNGWALTARCLDDLAGSLEPLDVLVVDNGSTDGTLDHLHARGVEVLALGENRGYGAALNAGVSHISARGHAFAWLLNNDLRVPNDAHGTLRRTASDAARPAVWTPALVWIDGVDQHVGGTWTIDGTRHALLTAAALGTAPREGRWLSGTALFASLDTLQRIGPFDETLFAYWEDVDWSLRATDAGVDLRVAADAVVTHVGTATTGGRGSDVSTFLLARNEVHVVRNRVPAGARLGALSRVVARQIRRALVLEAQAGRARAAVALSGLVAGLLGLRGPAGPFVLPEAWIDRLLRHGLAIARRLEHAAGGVFVDD